MTELLDAAELRDELALTLDPRRVEAIADTLAVTGDGRAVRPLLWRLGDAIVQDDPDVEDAVCSALVALGVMRCAGNRTFTFQSDDELPDSVVDLVREFAVAIPVRYHSTARSSRS